MVAPPHRYCCLQFNFLACSALLPRRGNAQIIPLWRANLHVLAYGYICIEGFFWMGFLINKYVLWTSPLKLFNPSYPFTIQFIILTPLFGCKAFNKGYPPKKGVSSFSCHTCHVPKGELTGVRNVIFKI